MARNIVVNVLPSYNDLPPPRDWLLASLSGVQLEAAIIRAALAPYSFHYGEEIVKFVPPQYSNRDLEYVERFSPVFQRIMHFSRLYVAVLASPLAHLPNYGNFSNRALSTHLWLGQRFEPADFYERLRLGLFKFLDSPDALVYPPPDGLALTREGHVPVRLFIMKIDHAYVTSGVSYHATNDRYPPDILMGDLHRIFSSLPSFRYTYSGSVYLLEKPEFGYINARCIGYSKRVFPDTTFKK